MTSAFTTLWTNRTCRRLRQLGQVGAPLELLFGGPHRSAPSFQRAGVRPGDWVYPIRVLRGELYLIARMRVEAILSLEDYIAQHPERFVGVAPGRFASETLEHYFQRRPEQSYMAPFCIEEVVIGAGGSPLRLDMAIPGDLLARLRYRSQRRERGIKYVEDGKLRHTLSIHGIYRLSQDSAQELDALFGGAGAAPPALEGSPARDRPAAPA